MAGNAWACKRGEFTVELASLQKRALLLVAISVAAIAAIFLPTVASLITTWSVSDTYTHGFFIFPASLYLIWKCRDELQSIRPEAVPGVIVLVVLVGIAWLLGDLGDVLLIKQFSLVAIIPLLVWAIMGTKVLYAILFPLGFLFFMVPAGQNLTAHLMVFTADFAVKLLQITGFTVHHDGVFITLPVGKFYVAEACSGIRYLIASVTIGSLYAYIMYKSYVRRSLFILASFIVPIIANGIRAYLIIVIAHHSGLKYAVGVDHVVGGAIFFGIVIFILFWLGRFGAELNEPVSTDGKIIENSSSGGTVRAQSVKMMLVAGMLLLLLLSLSLASANLKQQDLTRDAGFEFPLTAGKWRRETADITHWKPAFQGADAEWRATYTDGRRRVGVYLIWYSGADPESELINKGNKIHNEMDLSWQQVSAGLRNLSGVDSLDNVSEHILRSASQDILVWYWYQIDGVRTSNPYRGKAVEVLAKIKGVTDTFGVIVYSESSGVIDQVRSTLTEFSNEFLPGMDHTLRRIFKNNTKPLAVDQ